MSKSLYDRMKMDVGRNVRVKSCSYQFYNSHGIMADINAILQNASVNDTVLALEKLSSSDKIRVKTRRGDIYYYYPDGTLELHQTRKVPQIQGHTADLLIIDDVGEAHWGGNTEHYTMSRRAQLLLVC